MGIPMRVNKNRTNASLVRDLDSARKAIENLNSRLDALCLSVDRMIARAEKSEKREEAFLRFLLVVAGFGLGTVGESSKQIIEVLKHVLEVS